MYSNQVDTAHGLLYNVHVIANENLAVNCQKKLNLMENLTESFFRVSLTYRVKSAHKVKLTDQQLLQWMVPILLVMLIYLGTWTISDTPFAEFVSFHKILLPIIDVLLPFY